MELWETVCKSKLLANAMFILLLNKADILYAKLKAGIKFEDYVASYHGRPNKAEYVADCELHCGCAGRRSTLMFPKTSGNR